MRNFYLSLHPLPFFHLLSLPLPSTLLHHFNPPFQIPCLFSLFLQFYSQLLNECVFHLFPLFLHTLLGIDYIPHPLHFQHHLVPLPTHLFHLHPVHLPVVPESLLQPHHLRLHFNSFILTYLQWVSLGVCSVEGRHSGRVFGGNSLKLGTH